MDGNLQVLVEEAHIISVENFVFSGTKIT